MCSHHNPSSSDLTAELCQLLAAKSPAPKLPHYVSVSVHLFSLLSTLMLPWGCSWANCFLYLCTQIKVLSLSFIKLSMPLPVYGAYSLLDF